MVIKRRLNEPFKNGEDYSLFNIIPAKKDDYAKFNTEPKLKIHQARRSIEIDQDVVDALKSRYGSMPLGRAIRVMLGLKPKVAQNAWQEEEDALIAEYYPGHGSKHLAGVLGRSPDCIRDRASKLGVHRRWLYKRDRRGRKRKGRMLLS